MKESRHLSYVQEPNFMMHCWSSKGNHVMSILQVLRKSPGGTQRHSPVDETMTFVGKVLSMSSSALFGHKFNTVRILYRRVTTSYFMTPVVVAYPTSQTAVDSVCQDLLHLAMISTGYRYNRVSREELLRRALSRCASGHIVDVKLHREPLRSR